MSISRRLLRLAPVATLLVVSSLLTACSSDLTGPSSKNRSGYITTSASVQATSGQPTTSTTTTTSDTSSTSTKTTGGSKKSGSGDKMLSGYNVPAL